MGDSASKQQQHARRPSPEIKVERYRRLTDVGGEATRAS